MRRERDNSFLEVNPVEMTASFRFAGDGFEHRVVSFAHEAERYPAVIRVHDIGCRVYGSLHVPGLPEPEALMTSEGVEAHNELVERAATIKGTEGIRALKVERGTDQESSRTYRGYFASRAEDDPFLERRLNIVNLPRLANAIIRYGQSESVGAFFRGLVTTRRQVLDRLLRAENIDRELILMQDIYEDDRAREGSDRRHNFHLYFQDLGWNCRQYQKGLSFVFEGQRGEVEESLRAMLGKAPVRRIRFQEEIEREKRDQAEKLGKAIDMGRACGYCHEDFEKGNVKIRGELRVQGQGRECQLYADFHPNCYEKQEARTPETAGKGE